MSQAHLDHILAQLNAAQGNPQALTLATLNIVLEARGPQLRPLIEAAAIPHWFDRDILTALLPEHTISEETFAALTALPMVEPFQGKGWNVHESTRLALRHWLAAEHPERLRQLSARAADHFHPQPDAEVETLYHRLLADPEHAAGQVGDACYTFQQRGRQTELDRLGLVLAELLTLPQLPAAAEARACLHVVEIRRAYLTTEECQGLAQRALSLFQTQAVADGEMDAWFVLGDVEWTSGQLADAEQAYQQAKRILHDQLLATQTDAPRWLRDLAVAHNKLGDVRMKQGQLDAAAQAFSEGMAICTRLVALDPANTGRLRDLVVAHSKLGDVRMAQGQLDAAAQAFSEDLTISTRLVALDPANTGWLHDLAVAHGKLGDVRMAQGQLDAAAQAFTEYHAILARLVALDPANTTWLRELAVTHGKLGDVSMARGQLDATAQAFTEVHVILARLAALDSANTGWLRDLAVAHSKLGDVRMARGQLDVAAQAFSEDLAISTRLAALDPANIGWLRDLAAAYSKLGDVRMAQGQLDAAAQAFRAANKTP
jgi:tetratricopeptide (TPR) repeat protein